MKLLLGKHELASQNLAKKLLEKHKIFSYLHTEIELVLPILKSWTVHKINNI